MRRLRSRKEKGRSKPSACNQLGSGSWPPPGTSSGEQAVVVLSLVGHLGEGSETRRIECNSAANIVFLAWSLGWSCVMGLRVSGKDRQVLYAIPHWNSLFRMDLQWVHNETTVFAPSFHHCPLVLWRTRDTFLLISLTDCMRSWETRDVSRREIFTFFTKKKSML